MEKRISQLLGELQEEDIRTWFDLGLFLDRVRCRSLPSNFGASFSWQDFKVQLSEGGIAFCSFHYTVDGVTVEVGKYIRGLLQIIPKLPIHLAAGTISADIDRIISTPFKRHEFPEMRGFEEWPLYHSFFYTKFRRGDQLYNNLIGEFWRNTLALIDLLGRMIEHENIKLLFLSNVCSNPGNVSLALATVLLSESLGLPVISNNHDFYWEGGSPEIDRVAGKTKVGPRDSFFINSDVGEFFSIIEMLYPWNARHWLQVNINRSQSKKLIKDKGVNPANVLEIGTSVEAGPFERVTRRETHSCRRQLKTILSRYNSQLPVYHPRIALQQKLLDPADPKPILLGIREDHDLNLKKALIFLQPTRIMARKRIEQGLTVVRRLCDTKLMRDMLADDPELVLLLLATGPVPSGQSGYLQQLVQSFAKILGDLPDYAKQSVYLGFLFSEFDKPEFKKLYRQPVGIPDLYCAASLIMLPSETEGRGLPIIEAAACGRPILCSRYYPEQVYAEVIGEHLAEEYRLRVIEHRADRISDKKIQMIAEWVFFPQKYTDRTEHNRRVVNLRFGKAAMQSSLEKILRRMVLQLQSNEPNLRRAARAIENFSQQVQAGSVFLPRVVDRSRRQYIPGFGRLGFMMYLKSLIDPSFFRIEEQHVRGFVMRCAKRLVEKNYQPDLLGDEDERITRFYNSVESLFLVEAGEQPTVHDHSFSFRHRTRRHLPFYDLTHQEMTGVVNWLLQAMLISVPAHALVPSGNFAVDWYLGVRQLTNSAALDIDDRDILRARLEDNVQRNGPIAYFPGKYIKYELETFVVQSLRARLGLTLDDVLTEELLQARALGIAPVYVFCRGRPFGNYLTYETLQGLIESSFDRDLSLLSKYDLCKPIPTEQLSMGLHLAELGNQATRILAEVREKGGFLIANGQHAAVMTDTLEIDRFHIGRADHPICANMLGISEGSGFVLYLPAGVGCSVAYPVPVQRAIDVSRALHGADYREACKKIGVEKVHAEVRRAAIEDGILVEEALSGLVGCHFGVANDEAVSARRIKGRYADSHPWSGAVVKVDISREPQRWGFAVTQTGCGAAQVAELASAFQEKTGKAVRVAWNGGYILNPELVGKLALPESCIGAPLGMVVTDGRMLSAPLFNKPAILLSTNGTVEIRRINCSSGLRLRGSGFELVLDSSAYNSLQLDDRAVYYDLLFDVQEFDPRGHAVVQLMGNRIHSVRQVGFGAVERLPVGLTILLPGEQLPSNWMPGLELEMSVPGLEQYADGIEAGPLLVKGGEICVDMAIEGWLSDNSVKTQANRLDYTDLRGPKIGIGLDERGGLCAVTINSRIRESVGATYHDIARILVDHGAVTAMGFDPGGSSTLMVDGKVLNISPYNAGFESNIYALPPEPRAVSSAVLLWCI